MKKTPVLAITLGDQAGSSPELAAKVIISKTDDYIPVLIGYKKQFMSILSVVEGSDKLNIIDWDGKTRPEKLDDECYAYFYNIDVAEGGIIPKTITAESGKLIFEMLKTGVEMQNDKIIDGFLMAPITKAALHEAGYDFTSEFEVYDYLYNTEGCASVIRCDPYFRSTVVGHCSFREIADKITIESVKKTTYRLARIMKYFLAEGKRCRIGISVRLERDEIAGVVLHPRQPVNDEFICFCLTQTECGKRLLQKLCGVSTCNAEALGEIVLCRHLGFPEQGGVGTSVLVGQRAVGGGCDTPAVCGVFRIGDGQRAVYVKGDIDIGFCLGIEIDDRLFRNGTEADPICDIIPENDSGEGKKNQKNQHRCKECFHGGSVPFLL